MTDGQKETIKFYTTNDYLLINGLLWGEDEQTIDALIHIINEDGLGVMKEARELGYDVRWGCTKEEGERIYQVYQKRFPVISSETVKKQIIERARNDISNMMACMERLTTDLCLYRNIKSKFIADLAEGQTVDYLGFSSCSLQPHIAEQAMYGSGSCTLFVIKVPAGTPAIRLDQMPDVQNEPDEVILPPIKFFVEKIDKERNMVYMRVL